MSGSAVATVGGLVVISLASFTSPAARAPAEASVRDVEVNGTRLRVEATGLGPTVVFSHALFVTRRLFDAPVADLATDYRCVSYDLRGQGASSDGNPRRPPGVELDYEDAVALIEHLDAAPCHLVGDSLGAMVAMRIAARRPDLVRSLVILAARVRRNPAATRAQIGLLCHLLRTVAPLPPIATPLRRRLAEYIMTKTVGATFMADPDHATLRGTMRDELYEMLTPSAARVISAHVRFPESSAQMLHRIRVPTLVIAGDEDFASGSGVEHAREVQAAIPGARLLIVPRAGHMVVIEEPRVVSGAIRQFLAEVDAA